MSRRLREKLQESAKECDAVYLPRKCQMTGDVQIHEMVWVPPTHTAESGAGAGMSELWFVNTRFSCLATRSDVFSFIPRWRPRFVSALVPEDRCHLNGLCLRDDEVRYVTALGETDASGGWRKKGAVEEF